jgi:hypothetical protein
LEQDLPPYAIEYRRAEPSQRRFLHGISYHQLNHTRAHLYSFSAIKSTHPYFHRPLVEFVARIPRDQLCQPGRPRHLMRRALAGLLPSVLLDRRTKGLGSTVIDQCVQDTAPRLCRNTTMFLTEQYGCVDGARFRYFLQHPQSTEYSREELHCALTMELWFRTRSAAVQLETVRAIGSPPQDERHESPFVGKEVK